MCRNCAIKNGPLFTASQPQQPGSISISRTTIAELLISSLDFLSGPFSEVKNEFSLATCRRTSLPLIYNVQHGQYTAELMRKTGRTRTDGQCTPHRLNGHALLHCVLTLLPVCTYSYTYIQDILDAWINICFVICLIKSCIKIKNRMSKDGLLA